MDNIPDHIQLMADGEYWATSRGLTRQIPEDMPLSELTDAVDELEDIGHTLDGVTDRISALADRASTTLQAPIPGAGRARSVHVEIAGRPAFVLTMHENGSCTHHETTFDPAEIRGIGGTVHGTYCEVDPVDHTSITE